MAAFCSYLEQTYRIQAATAAAITAATFGIVVALLVGAPFGEWFIRRYKVRTLVNSAAPEPQLKIPEDTETGVETDSHNKPTMTAELLKATDIVVISIDSGFNRLGN